MVLIAYQEERMRIHGLEERKTTEMRLQRLEDREEIRQLLINYGRCLDQRDFAAFSKLFAEKDGEWIGGMGKAKGSQAIRKLMEESIGTNAALKNTNFHLFTNEIISLAGDRATATTKWIFVVKGEANRPQPVFMGHYQDDLVREKGNWKFLRRAVYADIPPDNLLTAGTKSK
jgi:uncharacterized protein (TIGR02246 family)